MGILLRLTLEHAMRNVFDVIWKESKEQHISLDKSCFWISSKERKRNQSTNWDNKEVESDNAGTSSTGIMSFAFLQRMHSNQELELVLIFYLTYSSRLSFVGLLARRQKENYVARKVSRDHD